MGGRTSWAAGIDQGREVINSNLLQGRLLGLMLWHVRAEGLRGGSILFLY